MTLTLKVENFTNNVRKVNVYKPDGTFDTLELPSESITCYPGCKVVFYHQPDKHWFSHTDSGVYRHLCTCEACEITVPEENLGNATLFLFSFGDLGDVFDFDASDGWVLSLTPHSFHEYTS